MPKKSGSQQGPARNRSAARKFSEKKKVGAPAADCPDAEPADNDDDAEDSGDIILDEPEAPVDAEDASDDSSGDIILPEPPPPKSSRPSAGSDSDDEDSDDDDDDTETTSESDSQESSGASAGPLPVKDRPVFKQELPMSCAPACVRMVVATIKKTDLLDHIEESEIREKGKRTPARPGGFDPQNGTWAIEIPKMLADSGIPGAQLTMRATVDDIRAAVASGKPAIIRLVDYGAFRGNHFVVIDEVKPDGTLVSRDPAVGRRTISKIEVDRRIKEGGGTFLITPP